MLQTRGVGSLGVAGSNGVIVSDWHCDNEEAVENNSDKIIKYDLPTKV